MPPPCGRSAAPPKPTPLPGHQVREVALEGDDVEPGHPCWTHELPGDTQTNLVPALGSAPAQRHERFDVTAATRRQQQDPHIAPALHVVPMSPPPSEQPPPCAPPGDGAQNDPASATCYWTAHASSIWTRHCRAFRVRAVRSPTSLPVDADCADRLTDPAQRHAQEQQSGSEITRCGGSRYADQGQKHAAGEAGARCRARPVGPTSRPAPAVRAAAGNRTRPSRPSATAGPVGSRRSPEPSGKSGASPVQVRY